MQKYHYIMKRRCSNRKLFFKLILLWSIAIVGYILYIEDCFLGNHSKYFYALNKAEFFVNGKKSGLQFLILVTYASKSLS